MIETDYSFSRESIAKNFAESMKEQERAAIRALVNVALATIRQEGEELDRILTAAEKDLKSYADTTFVANIKEGLEGQVATAAENYLTQTLKKPNLGNPVK